MRTISMAYVKQTMEIIHSEQHKSYKSGGSETVAECLNLKSASHFVS